MFSAKCNYPKLKTNLRLTVNRLKLLEKKKTELALKARKEIADYILAGKEDRARIRVEHIVREDYMVEGMEILEMFCDLLLARFGIIERVASLDPSIEEAIASVIWAEPRLSSDVPELIIISKNFHARYGKDFHDACKMNTLNNVNEKLQRKMSIFAPPKMLVENYMVEIAKSFNVDFVPDTIALCGEDGGGIPTDDLLGFNDFKPDNKPPPPPSFPPSGGSGQPPSGGSGYPYPPPDGPGFPPGPPSGGPGFPPGPPSGGSGYPPGPPSGSSFSPGPPSGGPGYPPGQPSAGSGYPPGPPSGGSSYPPGPPSDPPSGGHPYSDGPGYPSTGSGYPPPGPPTSGSHPPGHSLPNTGYPSAAGSAFSPDFPPAGGPGGQNSAFNYPPQEPDQQSPPGYSEKPPAPGSPGPLRPPNYSSLNLQDNRPLEPNAPPDLPDLNLPAIPGSDDLFLPSVPGNRTTGSTGPPPADIDFDDLEARFKNLKKK